MTFDRRAWERARRLRWQAETPNWREIERERRAKRTPEQRAAAVAYVKRWKEEHPERVAEYTAQSAEARRARDRARYAANREVIAAKRAAARTAETRAADAARAKEARRLHPERLAVRRPLSERRGPTS